MTEVSPEEIADLQAQEKARLDSLPDEAPVAPVDNTDPAPLRVEDVEIDAEAVEAHIKDLIEDFDDYDINADDDEDDDEDDEESNLVQVSGPIPLSGRCEITLNLYLEDVDTLEDALANTALTLGRFGMDPFYVVALDPDTGQSWVAHGGRVSTESDEPDDQS